jgi:nuclear pore complex protein Nup98-Nup96
MNSNLDDLAGALPPSTPIQPGNKLTSSSIGGFGSNNAFGAPKPGAFGAPASTAGNSLFGNNTTTAGVGFGGFGSNTTPATSTFGAANNSTGGGLFGAAKAPSFAGTSTGFGTTSTSSPFGATNTNTGGFGAPASTALGGATAECQGTGSTPFAPFIEKEPNSSSNQQNSFQSISFQQPYSKYSPEELRLADYNQGRRYGNASNQPPGAFGTPNFGGFGTNTNTNTAFGNNNNTGSTSTGLFGSTSTSAPFGSTNQVTSAFGAPAAATGSNLFGGPKPAGGLFGGSTTTPATGGGLFGSGSTGGGFGSGTGFGGGTTTTPNAGGLFGNNTTATNKPFSFGNTAPAATNTGFGAAPAATTGFGGGLFGNSTNTNTQQNSTGFGTQQQASNPFGGGTFGNTGTQATGASSLFGNQPAKPASLFGGTQPATGSTGGLFGGTQQAPAANNLFGGNNTTNTGGGLFGGGNKPGGLFGGTTATTGNASGGTLFGNTNANQTQPQQNAGGLFGGLNQPKPNSLFGAAPPQQGGNSLFGGSQGGGLFGGNNSTTQQQQQQPQNSLFGGGNSIFGQQQNQHTPQSLTASIGDNGAFGSASLFADLASNQVNNPGPIATPLSSAVKQKRAAAIPMYKLNSASGSRFSTPQKRGFGFSYSNYNSPSSASSTSSTPGFSGSLLGAGSFNRTLNKSMSTSSLRQSFNNENSILAPGAFSASSSGRHFGSNGNYKKLNISKNLRVDLFAPQTPSQTPPSGGGILKKRVSFDSNTNSNDTSSPLKQVNNVATNGEEANLFRPQSNGATANGSAAGPEMEQVPNGNNQLAIVSEEEPAAAQQIPKPLPSIENDEGYTMSPSAQELKNMNHVQRSRVVDFTVSRSSIGKVTFDVPVDLTSFDIDKIIGDVVVLTPRQCTVYPNPAKKPPMGKGLNVPSIISLDNSWPRKTRDGQAGPGDAARFKKHIDRLRKVPDTSFINYDKETGVWTFKVEHFTTYGLPEDEDEVDDMSQFGQSTLSLPPDTPTPKNRTPRSDCMDESFASTQVTESDPEDTFEFRKKKVLPGAFDDQELYADEDV